MNRHYYRIRYAYGRRCQPEDVKTATIYASSPAEAVRKFLDDLASRTSEREYACTWLHDIATIA